MTMHKAKLSESEAIFSMYEQAVKIMKDQGIDQWDEKYPSHDQLVEDIENEELYVYTEDDTYLAAIVLNEDHDKETEKIPWNYTDGPSLIIHRLVVHPEARGKGLAKKLLAFAEDFAHEHGYNQIRLDTYKINVGAVKLYEKTGYELRGEMDLGKEHPFVCFEKNMKVASKAGK
ncbi:GNAT family N-acetyltransferase [Terrilactibacillus laevilacticus]|uniref:GNAT family N-acetyltransferase n=1 Tax=Terrilactibacillus laevilacticus TaxID=1380157 RepID=A0ABW5PM40_9BACI|nr:GNAT family N-acetyltransferase [Terrilactibacillus laevilacticus]